MKREIVCVLGEIPCDQSKNFLRDYLAMDEAAAGKSAAPLFEEATRAFLRQPVAAGELGGQGHQHPSHPAASQHRA